MRNIVEQKITIAEMTGYGEPAGQRPPGTDDGLVASRAVQQRTG